MTPLPPTETPSDKTINDGTASPNLPLAKKVRAGLSWTMSSSLIAESLRFVRSIVLARFLAPEDFGLFAMALTIVAALNALSTLGISRTIVTSKFETSADLKAHLDTIWSVEIVRSLVIALLVAATAFPVSRFYGQAQLKLIIPILGLATLVQGFQNIGLVILRKEISFGRNFWYERATNAGGIALTIALAIVVRNVWALVIGLLLTAFLGTVLSYVFHSYRPHLAFEQRALRRALGLGKVAFVIAVASYLINIGDNVMIGRLLGAGALGNYSLAFNISSVPIGVLVFSLGAVLFPAYAEIMASRPKALEQAFTKVFSIALTIMVTITVLLFLLATEIVQLLFGTRWTTAGTVLRVLAFVVPLRGLSQILSTVSWGLNRPKDVAAGSTLEAVIFLAALYPLIRTLGVTGAAWAGVLAYACGCVIRFMALREFIPGILAKLFRTSLSILGAAGIGLLIARFSLSFLTSALPRVVVGGLLATIIPAAILLSFKKDLRRSLVELFS